MASRLVDKPRLLIVGGPNGSGKTTVAVQYAMAEGAPYVGADEIAASLDPVAPESVRIEAGRQFIQTIDRFISNTQPCVVESTLSGRSFRNSITRAAKHGFEIAIVFVFVDSADVCVARVAERVRKEGHDVPESDIRRRYHRSIKNF
ncbi:MAG: AAA family ATPase, partial [Pirellulales bacterium]|nr:AAA family ATPase [Pirellulales bacterium]